MQRYVRRLAGAGLMVTMAGGAQAGAVIEHSVTPVSTPVAESALAFEPDPLPVSLEFDAAVLSPKAMPAASGQIVRMVFLEPAASAQLLDDDDIADGMPADIAQALDKLKRHELGDVDLSYDALR